MPTFAFTARNGAGQVVQGSRAANDVSALRRLLADEGVLLVRSREAKKAGAVGSLRPLPVRELIVFTFHMQNVLDAGVPILSGLTDLREETRHPALRAVIADVIDRLNGGETFAQALAHHPTIFDQHYVSMVDAGEQSGRLPYVMERLVQLLEWREELRRSIRDMTTYPIVVLVALVGLVALVLGFVFPRFMEVFQRIDFELPWPTRVLIGASDFMQSWWWAVGLGVIAAWIGLTLLRRVDSVRLRLDTALLRAPIVGPVVSMVNFGQVAKALASFLDAGIALPRALELISRMVGNRRAGRSVDEARTSILAGETLTEGFRAAGLFPPLVLRMVRMGEQSGRLVEALGKVGAIYDREVPVRTKRLLDALSPILTGVMGGILLFVILSVLLPLYRMYQEIGTHY
ncbi:MAG: type II secretion system F family protein [Gemmatimonadetes bacterium]|nr:type II secretion system F family protein [Gemmatimonadota bacterium]